MSEGIPTLTGEAERERVVVVGTGYVGLPAALLLAHSGYDTVGIDINENLVKAITEQTLLLDEQELHDLLRDPNVRKNLRAQTHMVEGDTFIIAVPTPVDPIRKSADLSFIEAAIDEVCTVIRPGNLVIIESTVPPRATRDVIAPLIERNTGLRVPEDVMLAHCPERILPGDVFQELKHNERLVGGLDEASTAAATKIYASFVEGALHPTTDLIAELSKLMENTYRDVNIALANELAQICDHLGAPVREVFDFANRHPRVSILDPGIGVGGHCIPVDPWFLKEAAPYNSRLITTARQINDEMPARTAARIRKAVADLEAPVIVALGATYKRNSADARESPALHVVRDLVDDGYAVRHLDPLLPELSYADLGPELDGADLIVVLVAHDRIMRDLDELRDQLPGTRVLILDPYEGSTESPR